MNNETEIIRYEHTPVFIVKRDGEIDRRTMYLPSSTQLEIDGKAKWEAIKAHVIDFLNREYYWKLLLPTSAWRRGNALSPCFDVVTTAISCKGEGIAAQVYHRTG